MLTIMNRRNRALRDLDLFCELSSMGFALGTDFIVGHPGETPQIWNEAIENFNKFPLTHIHAFIFSPRNGTKSVTIPMDVDSQIAKERLKTLQNIVAQNNLKFRQNNADRPLDVLVEKQSNGDIYEGWDQYYNKIKIKSSKNIAKEWVHITDYEIMQESNYAQI